MLEYNQDIQKSQQAVNGALYSLKGIKTGFFPKLDITGNYSYQLEKVEFLPGTDLKHDNYGVEAGLVQNVYSGSAVRKQYIFFIPFIFILSFYYSSFILTSGVSVTFTRNNKL